MFRWHGPHNRRMEARIPLNGARLSWMPVLEHKRLRRKNHACIATILDLSLSGAYVRALHDPRIVIGTRILISAGSGSGIAEVRRINAADNPHDASYGIQFVHLDTSLFRHFNDTLAARGLTEYSIDAT